MSLKSNATVTAVAIGLGLSSVVATIIWLSRRHHKSSQNKTPSAPDPTKWQMLGNVAEIALYPLKSGAALELEKVDCNAMGLCYNGLRDRSLIILNEQQKIAWAGVYPRMLSIRTEVVSDKLLRLTAPNVEPLLLQLDGDGDGKTIMKQMKGYRLTLIECSAAHHEWCNRVIMERMHGLRLYIAMKPIFERRSWWQRQIKNELMPVMAVHDKSIVDLNARLSSKATHYRVHHQQFRGNLLIASIAEIPPYNDDNWLWLKIGDDTSTMTILRYAAPCLRCILPNIDISTCERNPDFEPLRTLKQYRLRSDPKEPEMGVYFDTYKTGTIRRGDVVYVQFK